MGDTTKEDLTRWKLFRSSPLPSKKSECLTRLIAAASGAETPRQAQVVDYSEIEWSGRNRLSLVLTFCSQFLARHFV